MITGTVPFKCPKIGNARFVVRFKGALFKKIRKPGSKIVGMLSCIAILCTLSGCNNKLSESYIANMANSETKDVFITNVPPKDCFLCGSQAYPFTSEYWGQKNIAIVCLNTLDFSYIELNKYDEHGKPLRVRESATSSQITFNGNEFSTSITVDSVRGIANGYIFIDGNEIFSQEEAATHLCSACFSNILNTNQTNSKSGVAVVNFESGEVQLVTLSDATIMLGDFYFTYNIISEENKSQKLKFLTFYCPERY